MEVKGATKSEVYSRWIDKNRIPTYDQPVDGTITAIKVCLTERFEILLMI